MMDQKSGNDNYRVAQQVQSAHFLMLL